MRCDPALVNNRFFLFQYLSPAYQDYLRAHTIPGSTVDRLHLTAVPDFTVALPPRVEQDAIADLLGALDDKVEVNRRVAETLEGMARALFRSWFVDFDPVRAKAAGRPTGLPDDLAALFPATLDDDGLPEGWRKARLDDVVASVVQRASPSPATAALPYVPIDAIRAKSITGIDAQDGSGAQSSLVSFRRDDILFGAMRPYFHKVALAPAEGTTRTTVFVLRPRLATDLMFALLLASGDETVDFATSGASGSTIPYATWDGALSLMPTTLPTPSIRAAFGKIVEPLVRKAQATIEESRTLAALRDTLLPRLISGELRIANAEREVAAA